MLKDSFDNTVTTSSETTLTAINRFVQSYLSYSKDFDIIFSAVEQDPDCVVALTHAAIYRLFSYTAAGKKAAGDYLQQAEKNVALATPREKLYFQAAKTLYGGDLDKAIKIHQQLASDYPGDIFAAKLGQSHCLSISDTTGMLALAQKIITRHQDCAYAHGMLAYGFEQAGEFAVAEYEGRLATKMLRKEPWAHHAVAHVMDSQQRFQDGIVWLEDLADTWQDCHSYMYAHNWWHIAIFYLGLKQYDKVLALYDDKLWGVDKNYLQDQIGAIAILLRLELSDIEVAERWQELAVYVAKREPVEIELYRNLLFAFALARAGKSEQADVFLTAMQQKAAQAKPFMQAIWTKLAIPGAKGFVAYARQDYQQAYRYLNQIIDDLNLLGASHTHRAIVRLVWQQAAKGA